MAKQRLPFFYVAFYFYLLCVILCLGSAEVLSEEKAKKSTTFQIRKKRLIAQEKNGNRPVTIQQVPYVVQILMNGVHICGGSILSTNIVLTAAHCITDNAAKYSVLSGSPYRNRGIHHDIIKNLIYPQYFPHKYKNDLAIFVISPHIDFEHSLNRNIELYNGQVPPNTLGTISGWGSIGRTCRWGWLCPHWGWQCPGITIFPNELRSITVPTISLEQCKRSLENDSEITSKVICVHDRIQGKHSCFGDSGNPLVIHERLAGVMVWNLEEGGPDIFMNLSYPKYRNWILSTIEEYSSNSHVTH